MKTFIQAIFLIFCISIAAVAEEARSNYSVNINTASAEQIAQTLDKVGLSKARAIVEYRKKHGAFPSAESLTQVKGIGEATFKLNKSKIRIK